MPEIASQKFVKAFQTALQKGGRLSAQDLSSLESAKNAISASTERAAADSLLALLRHDHELDAFEVAPVKKALGVLTGVSSTRLPADLAQVLEHAVPAANAKVKSYDLAFDLSNGSAQKFPASATVTLDRAAGATTILEVDPERLEVASVQAGGKAVPFEVKDGRLVVRARGLKALDIRYTVKPTAASDSAYGLIKDKYTGRMWTLTWPYNTGALFPSNSDPADGSTARVTVKVGGKTQVVGTGTQKGDAFETSAEAPAYAVAFYASDKFESGSAGKSHDGVAVSGYGVENKVPAAIRDAYRKTAKDALDFYSSWLGKYDYGETLKLVEVDGGLGGMEHTAAVAIMMSSARDPEYSKETAAHETAHHWFGDNLRIKSWGDFWMSEGFTNYATYRFFRAQQGDAKYFSLLDRAKGELAGTLASNPHALSAPAYTDVNEIFDSVPYEMGPWMLRMMEARLGTPKFDALLKGWYAEHRHEAVSTADFVKYAKAKTGEDFGPFFKDWNSITQVPSFRADVKREGNKVSGTLAPSGDYPKSLRLPLRLEGAGGKAKTVMVEPGKPFSADAGFTVTGVSWDPERTVLATVR